MAELQAIILLVVVGLTACVFMPTKTIIKSMVDGHEGDCSQTWINRNQVYNRLDQGVTGFFKNTKKVFFGLLTVHTGEEFHGIIEDGVVQTTEGRK